MFIIDDILLSPAKGLLLVFEEVHRAVEADRVQSAESVVERLQELYMLLETGKITEEAFDAQESKLLDLMDQAAGESAGPPAQDDAVAEDDAVDDGEGS